MAKNETNINILVKNISIV